MQTTTNAAEQAIRDLADSMSAYGYEPRHETAAELAAELEGAESREDIAAFFHAIAGAAQEMASRYSN